MKNFVLLTFFFSISFFMQAAVVQTVQNGSWNDANTWNTKAIPTAGDEIAIRHEVTVEEDLTLNNIIVVLEEKGALTVNGKCELRGLSALKIDEESVVSCSSFKTHTSGGIVEINGMLDCSNGELYFGGICSILVHGQLNGGSLKHRGNAELIIEGGFANVQENVSILGNTEVFLRHAEWLIGGDFQLKSAKDIYIIESDITVAGSFLGNSEWSIHLQGGRFTVEKTLHLSNQQQFNVSGRAEIVADHIKLTNNTSINGVDEGGMLKCNSAEVSDAAAIQCANGTEKYNVANYKDIPGNLDLRGGEEVGSALDWKNQFPSLLTDAPKVTVFPNPTTERITIEGFNLANKPEVYITNGSGQMENIAVDQESIRINMKEKYAPGLYTVVIRENEETQSIQVVLQ